MVVQVGADGGHVADHRDAHVLQMLCGAETRQQQKLRRAIGTTRHNDLAARASGLAALRGMEFDADRTVVLEQHARRMRAGADHQIGALACRSQIGLGGAPATAVQCRRLVVPTTFLLCTVEVGVGRNAGLHAGLQHRIGEFEAARLVGNMQRAADAVEVIRAAGLVLRLLEVRQDRIPVPALAAALAPFIVVAVVAADIDHAVDRAGPAKRLAARQIEAAVAKLRLRFGLEFPVHRGIDIGLGVAEGDVDPGVPIGRPCFQQQHAMSAGFGEARCHHAAGRTGTGDDEVVGLSLSPPSPLRLPAARPCDRTSDHEQIHRAS